MLKNNLVARPAKEIPENDKIELSEILTYFSNSHDLKDVKRLPANFKLGNMEDTFGFPLQQRGYVPQQEGYISYNLKMADTPADVKGYDYLFDFRNYQQERIIRADGLEVRYSTQGTDLKVLRDGKEIYETSLAEFAKQLHDKYRKRIQSGEKS